MTIRATVSVRLPAILAIGISLLFTSFLFGQEQEAKGIAGPDDWTHHRLAFSDPGTEEEAASNGTFNRWLRIVTDPRYILQHEKRDAAAKAVFDPSRILPAREPEPVAK